MALIPQALGLEAKDQGVSESAWIVQIAGTIIFQKLIHSWEMTIMRSVANYVNISKISASPGRFSKREVTYQPDPAGVSTSSVYRRSRYLESINQIPWDNYNFLDNLIGVQKSFCGKCDMNDLKMCFCD